MVFIPLAHQQDGGLYEPWIDTNDDGIIDVHDLQALGSAYGTSGTPINKTALLLELQSRLEALETRVPKKSNISISATAFIPQDNLETYSVTNYLIGAGFFYAAIQFPHEVNITKMTAYITDSVTIGYLTVTLTGMNLTNWVSLGNMAIVQTEWSGAVGKAALSTTSIANARVDNDNCAYTIRLYLSSQNDNLNLYGVVIEYEYLA